MSGETWSRGDKVVYGLRMGVRLRPAACGGGSLNPFGFALSRLHVLAFTGSYAYGPEGRGRGRSTGSSKDTRGPEENARTRDRTQITNVCPHTCTHTPFASQQFLNFHAVRAAFLNTLYQLHVHRSSENTNVCLHIHMHAHPTPADKLTTIHTPHQGDCLHVSI